MQNDAYVINHDEYKLIETQWRALYVNGNSVTYFDSFGVENFPEEIKIFIGSKSIIANIFRMQAYYLLMCGYFFIGFIDFMFKVKSLADFVNLF